MFYIMISTLIAGIVQGVTGFGSGIVQMMLLPSILHSIPQAAGVSTAISSVLTFQMAYTYRKHINIKKIVVPAVLYICVSTSAMYFSTMVNQVFMKKILGAFLVLLSIYYIFINKSNERKKLSLFTSIICIMISGACDGLFGIGGPLMVLYFLSFTHNTHEYLGTIQAFFCINCVYNTIFRIYRGILLPVHITYIGVGMLCILVGGMIANKVVNRLDGLMIRKLVYVMIGIAGLINII